MRGKGEEMKEKGGETGRGEGRERVGRRKGWEKDRREGRRGEGDEGNESRGEGMGGEVKEWERRWRGNGSTFHNLRKTTPSSDGWVRACVCSKFLGGGG